MPTAARTPYARLLIGLTAALALAAPLAAEIGGARTMPLSEVAETLLRAGAPGQEG